MSRKNKNYAPDWNVETGYIRTRVEELCDLKSTLIRMYCDQGLLDIDESFVGQGNKRLYSWKNLVEFSLIKEMSNQGIALRRIKEWLPDIKILYPELFKKSSFNEQECIFLILSKGPKDESKGQITKTVVLNSDKIMTLKFENIMHDQSAAALVINISELVKKLP